MNNINDNTVLFVPWALKDWNGYAAKASGAFSNLMGLQLHSIHQHDNPKEAVEQAEAIFIGGGEFFMMHPSPIIKDYLYIYHKNYD